VEIKIQKYFQQLSSMSVKKRLKEFIKTLPIGEAAFEKKVGLSNGLVSNIGDGVRKVTMEKITSVYPELNSSWLLTGEGEMLKTKNEKEGSEDHPEGANTSLDPPAPFITGEVKILLKEQLDILRRLESSLDYNTKRVLINEAIVRTHLHHSARVEARETGQKYQDIIADLNKATEAIFLDIFEKSEAFH